MTDAQDLLNTGSAWLEGQRATHLARTVQYRRGEQSVSVRATIGRTVFEVDDAWGVLEQWQSRDFLIAADELVLQGAKILPQPGDSVRETEGAKAYVYEAMAPGSRPCWRYADPYRRTLRVHAKHVATEDAT